ncbi:UPF0481 protein At3g47200-like [Triticum dicoccoides]|uniref:UPF0481 protein At3g47200-like n=1 Tax=Triticum dicoccoides TaxID=85692 RepID=UPI001890E57C|nr:UPF0481 protein At3g47200-like [Triticum dicoccoides]
MSDHTFDKLQPIYRLVRAANCSAQVREHFDLDGATSRNLLANPGHSVSSGNNSDEHADGGHFKILLELLGGAGDPMSKQQPTIYVVPKELTKKLDYNPQGEHMPVAVCLGRPYGSPGTQRMENYKWRCVGQLIRRQRRCPLLEPERTAVLLDGCLTSMECLLPRIRASYSEDTIMTRREYPDKEVADIMLKDGCFILHRLLKYAIRAKMEEAGGSSDQFVDTDEDWAQVYGRCFVWQLVTRDLLLLENQIPFFVIQELFQQLMNEDEHEELLVTGSLRLFRSLRPQMLQRWSIECDQVHHLLHLFYLSVGFPPNHRPQHSGPRRADHLLSEIPQWIPCAKELEEAGVRFRKRENATSFLNVTFSLARGILEIPQLELNDSSESLFRNLIAFEQTYPDTPRDVSTYAVFMDCLITSAEDMRILELHGVLVSHLSSRRVAWQFFSDVVGRVHWSTNNYLVGLMDDVNRYRERRRHKWRMELVRNYFSNPWVAMSVFAALLLLAMSVLQTFFAVYAYFKPPK